MNKMKIINLLLLFFISNALVLYALDISILPVSDIDYKNTKVIEVNVNIISPEFVGNSQLADIHEKLIIPDDNKELVFLSQQMLSSEDKNIRFVMPIYGVGTNGIYIYQITIFNDTEVLADKNVSFRIIGLKSVLNDFDVKICKEELCITETKYFMAGEDLFVKVRNPQNADIVGVIHAKNGVSEDLHFKDNIAKIKLFEDGKYTVDVILSKDGYFEEKRNYEIKVIKSPEIVRADNNIKEVGSSQNILLYYLTGFIVVFILFIILLFSRRSNK